MPDAAHPDSGSGFKTPRSDDLRTLKLGRPARPQRSASTDAPGSAGRADPSSTAGDWVEPGQRHPSATPPGWIEPGATSDRPESDADEDSWRRFSSHEEPGAVTTDHASTPPNHIKRLIAYFVDLIIIVAVLSVTYPALLNRPYIDIELIREIIEASSNQADGNQAAQSSEAVAANARDSNPIPLLSLSASTGINLAAYILYHGVLLGLTGATVGKRLMGITVCDALGRPIGVPRGVVRSIGLFLTTSLAAIGFIFVLFHPKRRALHDLVAGSYPVEQPRTYLRTD